MIGGIYATIPATRYTVEGLILGLCVAFIGLAVDNLIRTWAEGGGIY